MAPPRRYLMDESAFEQIDQSWKAHFLGWLFADGWISRSLRTVQMRLSSADSVVIDYFASKVYVGAPAVTRRKAYQFRSPLNGKTYTGHPQYGLVIYSAKACRDLNAKGLAPAKSLTCRFPAKDAVPDHLLSHFVRGYFEGDGMVAADGRSASILGSRAFLKSLSSLLKRHGIHSTVRPHRKGRSSISQLFLRSYNDLRRFSNFIYKDAEFCLERKRERFGALFETTDNSHSRNKTSAFIGVNLTGGGPRFMARTQVNGKRVYLGHFDTAQAASDARTAYLTARDLYVRKAA